MCAFRFEPITPENAATIFNAPVPPQVLRIDGILFCWSAERRRWIGANGVVMGWGRLDDLVDFGKVTISRMVEE